MDRSALDLFDDYEIVEGFGAFPKVLRDKQEGLRPALWDFAENMELKLRKNDHKTGWRDLPVEALTKLLEIELQEFKVATEFFQVRDARKELVDVANFCMMLWDRLSMLDQGKKLNDT